MTRFGILDLACAGRRAGFGTSARLAILVAAVVAASLAACDVSTTGPVPTRPISSLEVDLSDRYHTDAARLAVRRFRTLTQSPTPPVEIPDPMIERFYNALVAVWSLEHPARDSVVRLNEIHTFPHPELREVLVTVEPGSRLARAWQAGETLTGEPAADALIRTYRLRLDRYYAFRASNPFAVLRSDTVLDTGALALRFTPVPGVRYADPNAAGGDGNDIVAREVGDALFLDYSVGWGDCPAGCIHRHAWTFRIADGQATYVGSSGTPYRP